MKLESPHLQSLDENLPLHMISLSHAASVSLEELARKRREEDLSAQLAQVTSSVELLIGLKQCHLLHPPVIIMFNRCYK